MPKILLAEDDANLREIFEMRLRAEGYDVVTAGDGEEALVVAAKERPDLVVVDIMMPKISGFEMLSTLRANPETAGTKAVMMTALGQAEDRERGEALGVIKYLVKSQVTLEDFVRTIRDILSPNQANTKQRSNMDNQQTPTSNPMPAADGANPIPAIPPSSDTGVPVAPAVPASDGMSMADEKTEVENEEAKFAAQPAPQAPEASAPVTAPAAEMPAAEPAVTPATLPAPEAPAVDEPAAAEPGQTIEPSTPQDTPA